MFKSVIRVYTCGIVGGMRVPERKVLGSTLGLDTANPLKKI